MSEHPAPDSRSAISRAKFFLAKAQESPLTERQEYEAYLDAAIIFARSALHRVHKQFGSYPWFKAVWDSLLNDDAVNFFRLHRDRVLKEAPIKVGQRIVMGAVENKADALYFFEPDKAASETVAKHIARIAAIVDRCHQCEQLGFDVGDDIPFEQAITKGIEDRERAVESHEKLRQQKFLDGKKCFYCDGSGFTNAAETCSRCRGRGYLP